MAPEICFLGSFVLRTREKLLFVLIIESVETYGENYRFKRKGNSPGSRNHLFEGLDNSTVHSESYTENTAA